VDIARRKSLFALAALTVVGCLYYSSYYNYHFYWGDEGSVAVIAEKLSNGERPYVDIEPGYGVLWFYPIAILFKIFGPNFLVARIWFMCLGLAAALFAYALLGRLTRHRPVAFLVALLVLLFPGSGYKTYIPLLVIAGAYVLFLYDARTLKPTTAPWLALVGNGCYLSVAFLIRGDIATIYCALFLLYQGLTVSQAALREGNPRRLLLFPTRVAGVALVAVIVALPFAAHANAHGYLEGFLGQYSSSAVGLIEKARARFLLPSGGAATFNAEATGTLMPRVSLESILSARYRRWPFLTYAPLLALIAVFAYMCLDLARRRFSAPGLADFLSDNAYLIVLSVGAFSTFPQFFVFRPDIAHLSEFIPGFIVLCGYSLTFMRAQLRVTQSFAATRRWSAYMFALLCLAYLVAYATTYPEGLAFRRDRTYRLHIDNRLDLYFTRWEYELLDGLNTMIRNVSAPDDYVLCFPYCPGITFITGRPTFQKSLYVDDSFLISRPNWLPEMQAQIAARSPKVIVIWNWDVNLTNISRFPVWAAALYDFIGERYELMARIAPERDDPLSWYEVYVRK
jgi:hypothetical protein